MRFFWCSFTLFLPAVSHQGWQVDTWHILECCFCIWLGFQFICNYLYPDLLPDPLHAIMPRKEGTWMSPTWWHNRPAGFFQSGVIAGDSLYKEILCIHLYWVEVGDQALGRGSSFLDSKSVACSICCSSIQPESLRSFEHIICVTGVFHGRPEGGTIKFSSELFAWNYRDSFVCWPWSFPNFRWKEKKTGGHFRRHVLPSGTAA